MAEKLINPLLQQVQAKLEAGMRPELRVAYEKAVHDGWEAALKKGPDGMAASLAKSRDPVADAARGGVAIALLLQHESKGGLPMPAAVAAASDLMLRGLDFLGQAKIMQIAEPELARAGHIFGDFLFARLGISKAGFAGAAQKIHALTQDPDAVHKMQMKAGFVRHPLAATPTPGLPQAGGGLLNGSQKGGTA